MAAAGLGLWLAVALRGRFPRLSLVGLWARASAGLFFGATWDRRHDCHDPDPIHCGVDGMEVFGLDERTVACDEHGAEMQGHALRILDDPETWVAWRWRATAQGRVAGPVLWIVDTRRALLWHVSWDEAAALP